MTSVRLSAAVLALVAAGGCVDDDRSGLPVRPPGGGGPGSNEGGDATPIDAPGSDGGGGEVRGLICVVTDLRSPDVCPAVPAREGVAVAVRGTADATVSDAEGRFTLPVGTPTVTLDVAGGSATLERATVPAAVGALVHAPVIGASDWADVLASLDQAVPDGGGAIVVYVSDAGAPASGVAFATIAGSSIAPYYDAGGALAWAQGTGTGAAGVALLVDVPPGTVTLDGVAPDLRVVAPATVPVAADAITFVRASLAPPP